MLSQSVLDVIVTVLSKVQEDSRTFLTISRVVKFPGLLKQWIVSNTLKSSIVLLSIVLTAHSGSVTFGLSPTVSGALPSPNSSCTVEPLIIFLIPTTNETSSY